MTLLAQINDKFKESISRITDYINGKAIICIDYDDEKDNIPIPKLTNKNRYENYKRFLKNDYIREHLYDKEDFPH